MSRIIPQKPSVHSELPDWLNVQEIVNAGKGEVVQDQETLKKLSSVNNKTVIVSYSCNRCKKVIQADNKDLQAQSNLYEREGEPNRPFVCPDCGEGLTAYKTVVRSSIEPDNRYSDQIAQSRDIQKEAASDSGTMNTIVDRHLCFKAINALTDFAHKQGMIQARARSLRGERVSEPGQQYPLINKFECEIEWLVGKKLKKKATATIAIDPAGKYIFPKVLKFADGTEVPFEKDYIKNIEQQATFDHPPKLVERKSDILQYKKPDPTRFHAIASEDNEAMIEKLSSESKKKVPELEKTADYGVPPVTQPGQPAPPQQPQQNTTPQTFAPNSQIVNLADGKTYNVVSTSPAGTTVSDPATGQQSVIPANQQQNVKPALKTTNLKKTAEHKKCPKCPYEGSGDEFVSGIFDGGLYGKSDTTTCPKCGYESDTIDFDTDDQSVRQPGAMDRVTNRFPASNINKISSLQASQTRWNDYRRELESGIKHKEKIVNPFSREAVAARELGLSPLKPDPDKTGHDKRTNIPGLETKDIVVGLTEFPKDQKKEESTKKGKGYNIPFKDMDENQVEEREHFDNEKRLPIHRMKREELSEYIKGVPERNLGLNDESDDNYGLTKEEKTALQDLVGLVKKFAEARSDARPFPGITREEVEKGTGVETEHTDDVEIARQIAVKHLSEVPDYYDKLEQVEGSKKTAWVDNPSAKFGDVKVGDRVDMVCDSGMGTGGESTVTKISQKFDETTGEKYNVIWCGRHGYDARSGDPVNPPWAYYISSVTHRASLQKTAADVPTEVPKEEEKKELPVQYNPNAKRAPSSDAYKEPGAIPELSGKAKEALTKLPQAGKTLKTLQDELDAKTKPLQESIAAMRTQDNPKIAKAAELLESYKEMAYREISSFEEGVAHIEDKIVTAYPEEVGVTSPATLAQVVKEAEGINAELAESIKKLRAVIENRSMEIVIKRFLTEFPISEKHEKKLSAQAGYEEALPALEEISNLLKSFVMALKSVNLRLLAIA